MPMNSGCTCMAPLSRLRMPPLRRSRRGDLPSAGPGIVDTGVSLRGLMKTGRFGMVDMCCGRRPLRSRRSWQSIRISGLDGMLQLGGNTIIAVRQSDMVRV